MEQKILKIRQQNRRISTMLLIVTYPAILAKIIYMYFLPMRYFLIVTE